MRRFACLSIFLLLCLISCVSVNADKQASLATSLLSWQNLKAQNDNHYAYKTTFTSVFGFGSETSFEVKDDIVIKRSYSETVRDDATGQTTTKLVWTEEGANVGQNKTNGSPARTIEQAYAYCKDEILTKDPFANMFFLEIMDDGILSSCSFVPNGCQDDCSTGINIRELSFIKK